MPAITSTFRSGEPSFPDIREDLFERFIRDRASKRLNLIEEATGKRISGGASDEVSDAYKAALN